MAEPRNSSFSRLWESAVKLPARLIIMLVKLYQVTLSPYLGGQCRFVPTCSVYCIEAVEKYGAFKGSLLGVRRILRCHPFCRGGFDPVP